MLLDFNPSTKAFILRVPRSSGITPLDLMRDHGLDWSKTASTPGEAVMFTREPYAAVAFWQYATPAAQGQLVSLNSEIELSWLKEGVGHIDCPADEQLAPFQIAGVQFAKRRKNTLIGDVPGLGKTAQAICFANEIRAKSVLVICPANIRLQWAKNIRRWSTMEWPYVVYPIMHGRHGTHPTAAWTVVSYDLARTPSIGKALAKRNYDLLILDEAHYLKEFDAQRTRAVFGGGSERHFEAIATRADAILALTGTPLPNRPRECYTLLRGLNFDAIDWMSEDSFRERFNPSRKGETADGKIFIDERSGRHGELQARLRANVMVRREKHGPNGVGYQLKMMNLPNYDIIHMEATTAVKQALAAESLLEIDPETWEGADVEALGHIAVVRRMMGEALAPLVGDYVDMCLRGGEEKIVLFGHHISVLNCLEHKLAKWGVVRIDGSTSAAMKQKKVELFIKDPTKQVCLGNMQSMGTGTDGLQEVARHAIFAEADWTPGVNQQAVDRLDRGGQAEQVQADFCVAPGSFSERILASALRKLQVTHKALDHRIEAA